MCRREIVSTSAVFWGTGRSTSSEVGVRTAPLSGPFREFSMNSALTGLPGEYGYSTLAWWGGRGPQRGLAPLSSLPHSNIIPGVEERYSQSSLLVHSVFAYALKFVTPKSILAVLLWSFLDMSRAVKNLDHPICTSPAERLNKGALCLLVSALVSKQVSSSHSLCSVVFPHFGACRWWFHCLRRP